MLHRLNPRTMSQLRLGLRGFPRHPAFSAAGGGAGALILGHSPFLRTLSTGPTGDAGDGTVGMVTSLVQSFAAKVGIEGNQFATGGLTLAVVGAAVGSFSVLWRYFLEFLQKQLIVSAEFESRDEAYSWLMSYLADHPMSKRTTRFSVTTSIRPGQKTEADEADANVGLPRVYFLPSPGTHIFTFQNRLLWLSRERPKSGPASTTSSPLPERLTINSLGRNRAILESLVHEARRLWVEKDRCRTVIYSADQYGSWRRIRSRPIRPLSTIVLDEGVKEGVVRDVREFLGSEKWYADRGIPYRRGYMFYGSPGTGKTSFVTGEGRLVGFSLRLDMQGDIDFELFSSALAGELKLNIYVISLANRGLTDETLTELMVDTPPRCILLLEDIDAAFISRTPSLSPSPTPTPTTTPTNVTFSGLLNAIDGVAAQEGRLLCMTTNHLEKLDPALIRPGRVDVRVWLDLATRFQIRELFVQFFPHVVGKEGEGVCDSEGDVVDTKTLRRLAEEFADAVPERTLSIAQVQGFLMRWKKRPVEAVRHSGELVGGRGSEGQGQGQEKEGE
ncbi:BCS1 N terminal-domain-containing protein [Fimicolochytrium jonesii]|uniref:BCS1 N terminal-domain-containing protein n=1 Tax=Fimicolochytrium jonesii TaxID=1396493 RepID=UPI0022FF253E|nr:BCS1 N terminal-domain-containing protein [Fimicolochytrium jonesii]KAI8824485.1 BCS1 N terminal-domain-containing protein [Fimicolochytrium jonesii]